MTRPSTVAAVTAIAAAVVGGCAGPPAPLALDAIDKSAADTAKAGLLVARYVGGNPFGVRGLLLRHDIVVPGPRGSVYRTTVETRFGDEATEDRIEIMSASPAIPVARPVARYRRLLARIDRWFDEPGTFRIVGVFRDGAMVAKAVYEGVGLIRLYTADGRGDKWGSAPADRGRQERFRGSLALFQQDWPLFMWGNLPVLWSLEGHDRARLAGRFTFRGREVNSWLYPSPREGDVIEMFFDARDNLRIGWRIWRKAGLGWDMMEGVVTRHEIVGGVVADAETHVTFKGRRAVVMLIDAELNPEFEETTFSLP
jgi:hypothetical protein